MEKERGPQHLAYDFWWHLGHDTMITSEWGTPNMVENGVNPELLLAGNTGPRFISGICRSAATCKRWTSGAEYQMVLDFAPPTIRERRTGSSASSRR